MYGNPGRHAQLHTNHKPPFHSAHDVALRIVSIAECPANLLPRSGGLLVEQQDRPGGGGGVRRWSFLKISRLAFFKFFFILTKKFLYKK